MIEKKGWADLLSLPRKKIFLPQDIESGDCVLFEDKRKNQNSFIILFAEKASSHSFFYNFFWDEGAASRPYFARGSYDPSSAMCLFDVYKISVRGDAKLVQTTTQKDYCYNCQNGELYWQAMAAKCSKCHKIILG